NITPEVAPETAVETSSPQKRQATPRPLAEFTLLESLGRGRWRVAVRADGPTDPPSLLARVGQTPLPPYLRKARRARDQPEFRGDDQTRYNTVFAQPAAEPAAPGPDPLQAATAGSVAAPTAGLHFTPPLLRALDRAGVRRAAVTLQVGLGTFLPVQTETLEAHPIHREWTHTPPETLAALRQARLDHGRILAVGTTTVRTLESLPPHVTPSVQDTPADLGYTGDTGLFITPDAVAEGRFAFRFTDRLLTNFHLPRSTLLALVAALPGVGVDRLLDTYRQAIERGYRFYSFGDAMLIV
ncbi:MAG: S-adenosylmethionine:tRNA ribosyltransferase-isomerase, partial [Planctomycetota bacterium]